LFLNDDIDDDIDDDDNDDGFAYGAGSDVVL